MKEKIKSLGLSIHQVYITLALCLFGLLSTIYVALTTGELFSYFYCFATVPFVALPLIMSALFRWRMNWLFYGLFTFYTCGPLLGAVYNLYYYTSWWDDLLHIMAGTVFAVVGAELAYVLNKGNKTSPVFAAIFGVLISISIAVVWEIFEFSCDTFLGSDMQADTIVNFINTKINRTDGIVDTYIDITETVVNGESLGINGYLDIGLIDTMNDMIIETVGALVLVAYTLVDKNKHPMIVELKKNNI